MGGLLAFRLYAVLIWTSFGLASEATTLSGATTLAERHFQNFDAVGRLTYERSCSYGLCGAKAHDVYYGYDLAGNMSYQTNGVASKVISLYYSYNWLGTKRVAVSPAGTRVTSYAILPFGDDLSVSSGIDPSEEHYTRKERDAESGLDNFGARYFGSSLGRFMSPDYDEGRGSSPVPTADFTNPQTLNLYAYALNNPLTNTDSDGHSVNVCTTGSDGNQQCTLMSNDQYTAAQQGNGSLNAPTLDQVGSNGTEAVSLTPQTSPIAMATLSEPRPTYRMAEPSITQLRMDISSWLPRPEPRTKSRLFMRGFMAQSGEP